MKILLTLLICCLGFSNAFAAESQTFASDVIIASNSSEIKITFLGHATLYIESEGKVIHIDPWAKLADYTKLPKADIILLTHEHPDHLDAGAIEQIRKDSSTIVYTAKIGENRSDGKVYMNYDSNEIDGILLEAVPAYNIMHKRPDGTPYHPKGIGNGYILNIGGKRIYIAGDTENVPELQELKNIDVAFLPMNLPYTMTPEMVADLAIAIKPEILYPYHFGDTDTTRITELLQSHPEIEVRIRKLQ